MSGTGFVKLYSSILDSSVWAEPAETRLLWVTLLAMADANGIVRSSVPGLAHRARISREACEIGLESLQAPDPDSVTPDHEGRRLARIEGGWLVLNHRKHRDMRTDSQIKGAERVKRFREHKASVTCNAGNAGNAPKRAEEEEKEEEEKVLKAQRLPPASFPVFPTKDRLEGWTLTGEQIRAWAELYPHLDVEMACRIAWGHVDSDPAKRCTARGMKTFLNGWLGRERNCRKENAAGLEAASAREQATALDLARRALTARAFAAGEDGAISAADRERIVTEAEAATSREALEAIRWP